MNKFANIKPLLWLTGLLMVASVAGCGSGGGVAATTSPVAATLPGAGTGVGGAGKGPAPVALGMAGNYVILANSAISTVPASAIT
jgi:hypothetical protein